MYVIGLSSMNFKDLTGLQHNNLTVLKLDRKENKRTYWLCKCICGAEKIFRQDSLRNKDIFSCGCYGKITRKNATSKPKGVAAINKLYYSYKISAKSRGLEFSLSLEYFLELTSSECYYCGNSPKSFVSMQNDTGTYVYNGVDRVDNNMGYIIENVVSCCSECNYAKHIGTSKDYIERCIRVANKHKRNYE